MFQILRDKTKKQYENFIRSQNFQYISLLIYDIFQIYARVTISRLQSQCSIMFLFIVTTTHQTITKNSIKMKSFFTIIFYFLVDIFIFNKKKYSNTYILLRYRFRLIFIFTVNNFFKQVIV